MQGAEVLLAPHQTGGCDSPDPHTMGLTSALRLLRKPKAQQPYLSQTALDATIRLGQARGKLNAGKLVRMLVKSKLDRLLAPRQD